MEIPCKVLDYNLLRTIVTNPLSMGLFRQEYWSGLPFPSPGDLPSPGTKPTSPALTGRFFTTEPPGKPLTHVIERGLEASRCTEPGVSHNDASDKIILRFSIHSKIIS